jgi:hypothetical protein
MKIATRLAQIELIESGTGEPVQLQSFWADRTTVLIFLRHFG